MTRISENYLLGSLQFGLLQNRLKVAKHTEEISSGYKVVTPGDTEQPGLISKLRETKGRMDSHLKRISGVLGSLDFQDGVLGEAQNITQRALELATQGANEIVSVSDRARMAEEVLGLRDQLVSLANSSFEGTYVFGGATDTTPPFSEQLNQLLTPPATPFYQDPPTGAASIRYAYTTVAGATTTRTVDLSDTTSIRINGVGSDIFTGAVDALERLGRALAGYKTDPAPPASPTETGVAYVFPGEFTQQTADIRQTIDLLKAASQDQIGTERASIGARTNQLLSAKSVVESTQMRAQESISALQDADIVESATNLTQAETALQATMTLTGRVLRMSILDYL